MKKGIVSIFCLLALTFSAVPSEHKHEVVITTADGMNNGMRVTVIGITVGNAGIATVPSGIDTATRSPRVSEPAVALS